MNRDHEETPMSAAYELLLAKRGVHSNPFQIGLIVLQWTSRPTPTTFNVALPC